MRSISSGFVDVLPEKRKKGTEKGEMKVERRYKQRSESLEYQNLWSEEITASTKVVAEICSITGSSVS